MMIYGCSLKMVGFPTNHWFSKKIQIILGCEMGVPTILGNTHIRIKLRLQTCPSMIFSECSERCARA